ncbi:unnamed protein product [Dovyalis caffra]|uniref:NADH-ubiquinone oxidoreductase chain 4 n=2 Tax=Dovyalis caffra TaxID=77055 RepID=A0AAV1R4G6_9ROSI|nr:unnamed protein product [Dovyalis caffra]
MAQGCLYKALIFLGNALFEWKCHARDMGRSNRRVIPLGPLTVKPMHQPASVVANTLCLGWSGMRSYGKEYITASLIREFLMIAVFRMLDLLLFYGPCAVNPLRAVVRRRKVVAAKLSEGVLLGVCRGCVCSREWIPRQVSLGGVDTLARIRVTATREKSKGNCTRPGMDVNSPHSIFLPNEPISLLIWKTGLAFGSKGMVFSMSPDRAPLVRLASERFFRARSRPGPTGRHLPQRKLHCSPPPEKQKIRESQAENTCIDSGLMTRADDGSSGQSRTTDLQISLTTEFSERRQIFLWIASFASFAVKVPMVPVHIWLPEAHVEAPTAGSVILAGIPLKLGTYGFLRFSIPMFPEATLFSTPFIYTPSAIAIIYTSLTTSRQIDLKKIIAYSSVAHMNLVTIGMFSRAAAVRQQIGFAPKEKEQVEKADLLEKKKEKKESSDLAQSKERSTLGQNKRKVPAAVLFVNNNLRSTYSLCADMNLLERSSSLVNVNLQPSQEVEQRHPQMRQIQA